MGGHELMKIVVNESFRGQRLTGQQRYAAEISRRLMPSSDFAASEPGGLWSRSKALVWVWVQVLLPLLAGRRVVLSLTSRAPLWCRRHVVVVHDLFVLEHPEWYSRSYYWTHAPLLRSQIKTAAGIIAVSEPVAHQLRILGRPDVVVAPNAPSEVFAVDDHTPSSLLVDRGLAAGSYFLSVGSRDPRKNLRTLALAYGLLDEQTRRDHPLVLVGGGASIYRDEEIDLPQGTVEVGYVDDEDLRRLYRDARTVVFVSLAEGFGLPLVEAAAAGANSILVSDTPVFRWICGSGARYVDPLSESAIADGMRAELVSPTRPVLDGQRFDWGRSAEEVSRLCREVREGTSHE